MSINAKEPVALVTGGSRGLGRAIAVKLARKGYQVLINFRQEQGEAEVTAGMIARDGGVAMLCRADLSRVDELTGLFKPLKRLDVLVNNAGITRDEMMITMRRESWDAVLATNLSAVIHCSRMAARLMCARRSGIIINIGSSSAASARMGQANYCAAKSALFGLGRSMARELARQGVRVMTVAPGFTTTDMASAVADDRAQSTLERIPLGRWGTPDEIAAVVAFLTTQAASGFSGQAIMVDGGRTAFETESGL